MRKHISDRAPEPGHIPDGDTTTSFERYRRRSRTALARHAQAAAWLASLPLEAACAASESCIVAPDRRYGGNGTYCKYHLPSAGDSTLPALP